MKINFFLAARKPYDYKYDGSDYRIFFNDNDIFKFLEKHEDYDEVFTEPLNLYDILTEAYNISNSSVDKKVKFINKYANKCIYYRVIEQGHDIEIGQITNINFEEFSNDEYDEDYNLHFPNSIEFYCTYQIGKRSFEFGNYENHPLNDFSNTSDHSHLINKNTKKKKGKVYNKPEPDYIYFIKNLMTDSIKIGVSKNVKSRMSQLQTSTPHKLKLIKTIEGSYDKEKELHEKFSHIRLTGEWFKVNDELLQYIDNL